MKVIRPSAALKAFTPDAERHLELCARTCYKSEGKADGTIGGAQKFLTKTILRGHESVIEHASATARIVCDRGVTHEIVRHRLASYSQESTRYCNYGNTDHGCTFILPPWVGATDIDQATDADRIWFEAMAASEKMYLSLLEAGWSPQQARSVLPNSLKTEIVMTANMREWRHFFRLRCAPAAHPQMREVATMLLYQFNQKWPSLFCDIVAEVEGQDPFKRPHMPLSGDVRQFEAMQKGTECT